GVGEEKQRLGNQCCECGYCESEDLSIVVIQSQARHQTTLCDSSPLRSAEGHRPVRRPTPAGAAHRTPPPIGTTRYAVWMSRRRSASVPSAYSAAATTVMVATGAMSKSATGTIGLWSNGDSPVTQLGRFNTSPNINMMKQYASAPQAT